MKYLSTLIVLVLFVGCAETKNSEWQSNPEYRAYIATRLADAIIEYNVITEEVAEEGCDGSGWITQGDGHKTECPGSQICLLAIFENTVLGTDNIGKTGKRTEDIGKEAAMELLKEQKSQACLDKCLADQLLPYMALVPGKSQVTVSEITDHCKTNIWVIEKFLNGNFNIKDNLITWTPI